MWGEAVSETKRDVFLSAIDLVKTWWPYPGNAQRQADILLDRWSKTEGRPDCPYCHSDGHTRWDNRSTWGSKEILDSEGADDLCINLSHGTLLEAYVLSEFKINYCPMCGRELLSGASRENSLL